MLLDQPEQPVSGRTPSSGRSLRWLLAGSIPLAIAGAVGAVAMSVGAAAGAPAVSTASSQLVAGTTSTHLAACRSRRLRPVAVRFAVSPVSERAKARLRARILRPRMNDGGVVVRARAGVLSGTTITVSLTCRRARPHQVRGPFKRTSFWNRPLSANAALDPDSQAYVSELRRQVREWGPWINTDEHSTPVYTVARGQQRVAVRLDSVYHDDLRRILRRGVPVPKGARAAAGTDRHMVIWQPSTDTMWEFWQMRREGSEWVASAGGRMTRVSRKVGSFPYGQNWGATATGLPLLGGLIREGELTRGRIDHALAIALPETRRAWWVKPAERTDGYTDGVNTIPQGTRFRLDPSLDLTELRLPRATRILAEAAQTYGLVVRDTAGAVTLYAEDVSGTGRDPYSRLFAGGSPGVTMARFPWEHVQTLRLGKGRSWSD